MSLEEIFESQGKTTIIAVYDRKIVRKSGGEKKPFLATAISLGNVAEKE